MLVDGYDEYFYLLTKLLFSAYLNIHTILLNHDCLMGYFYEIVVLEYCS